MDRLSEIRARTIAAGRSKDAEFDLAIHAPEDIPYLLEQINIATARAEKAEAERDTCRAALEALHISTDLLKGE